MKEILEKMGNLAISKPPTSHVTHGYNVWKAFHLGEAYAKEQAAQLSLAPDESTTEAIIEGVDKSLEKEGMGNVWRFKVKRFLREHLRRRS